MGNLWAILIPFIIFVHAKVAMEGSWPINPSTKLKFLFSVNSSSFLPLLSFSRLSNSNKKEKKFFQLSRALTLCWCFYFFETEKIRRRKNGGKNRKTNREREAITKNHDFHPQMLTVHFLYSVFQCFFFVGAMLMIREVFFFHASFFPLFFSCYALKLRKF